MRQLVLYIHGKGGNAMEADHYKTLFAGYDVIGIDYHADNPWDAISEFKEFFHRYRQWYDSIILIANSIGAYFSMCALNNEQVDKAFFISPIVDMEKVILDMMRWADITEEKLREKQLIATGFGETLSWEYLCYVRNHPVNWSVPTYILYGDKDNLTSQETIHKFANDVDAELTIMQNGMLFFQDVGRKKTLIYNLLDKLPKGNLITDLN